MNSKTKILSIAEVAIFIAMVFAGTSFFKVPTLAGYNHIGDSFIFLAVLIIGKRKGALAGSFGAALADLIGGYAAWILPTFIIKGLMAYTMGALIERLPSKLNKRIAIIVAIFLGGSVEIVLYLLANKLMYGTAAMIAAIPGMFMQVGVGLIICEVLSEALYQSPVKKYFEYKLSSKNS